MANPNDVDRALDYIADAFQRQPATPGTRRIWHDTFADTDAEALMAATKKACRLSKYAPTMAVIAEAVAAVDTNTAGPSARSCGRCADGLREMAVHRRDPTEPSGVRITVGVVRCDCPRGHVIDQQPGHGCDSRRTARIPDLRGQIDHVQRDPSVLAWFLDPSAAERRNLDEPAPAPRSAAIAHVRGVVLGSDPETRQNASQRARTVAADRMREAAGEEVEWSA